MVKITTYDLVENTEIGRREVLKYAATCGITLSGSTVAGGVNAKGDRSSNEDKDVYVPAGKRVPATAIEKRGKVTKKPPNVRQPTKGVIDQRSSPVPSTDSSDSGTIWLLHGTGNAPSPGFGTFEAYFEVPPEPSDAPNDFVAFYFPSLTSFDGSAYILQPVLAWNWGGSGSWEIASWAGNGNKGYIHSELITTSPGNTIYGSISGPYNGGDWYVQTYDMTQSINTQLYSHQLSKDFGRADATLEVNDKGYDFGDCSSLPGGTEFYDMYLTDRDGYEHIPVWNENEHDDSLCPLDVEVPQYDTVRLVT